jgi:NADH-quinone oxidoreductase subunit J
VTVPAEALFLVSSVLALIGAVATVVARRPLRAAMGLLVTIIALAGLFLTLHAQLLAAIQLIVYAGAIVVLFVFVIMLIGPSSVAPEDARGLALRSVSGALMAMITLSVGFAVYGNDRDAIPIRACEPEADCVQFGGVEALGRALYLDAMVPFELISITLLVAIIGALAVARGRTEAEHRAAEQLRREAREREQQLTAEAAAGEGQR